MAKKLSRRLVAAYCADQLLAGNGDVITQLAAFLLDTKRTRELELVARDIEDALQARGVVVADVASARQLSPAAKAAVTAFIKQSTAAKRVELRSDVDERLLGGLKLNLPGQELDSTILHRLTQLKANKV